MSWDTSQLQLQQATRIKQQSSWGGKYWTIRITSWINTRECMLVVLLQMMRLFGCVAEKMNNQEHHVTLTIVCHSGKYRESHRNGPEVRLKSGRSPAEVRRNIPNMISVLNEDGKSKRRYMNKWWVQQWFGLNQMIPTLWLVETLMFNITVILLMKSGDIQRNLDGLILPHFLSAFGVPRQFQYTDEFTS